MRELFKDYDSINLNNDELQKFLNGVKLKIQELDGLYNIYSNEKYIGTGLVASGLLKRDIIEN